MKIIGKFLPISKVMSVIFHEFGEKWRLLPSVRYRSLSSDVQIETINTSVDLNDLSIGVGISLEF